MPALLEYLRRHHVGLVALFIALSGSAYAASLPRNSVGTKQLKDNAVTAAKIKPNSITSADVGDGALRREDFAAGQIPAGPQGPGGQQGVQGPRGERGPSEAFGAFFDDVSMPPAGGFVDLASLDLAPGQYIVTGSFVVKNFQEHPRDVACTLGLPSPGGLVDLARVRVDTGGDQDAVVMLGGIDLETAATVTIHCTPSGTIGTTGTLDFEDIDIGAIRVGALHTT